MGYATKEDIDELYGTDLLVRVADHNKDGTPDPSVIEMGLQTADDLCNAYLSALYSTPIDPVPGVVKKCAIDIAIYNMAHGRMQRTDEMRMRYEDALKILGKISEGKIGIGQPPGGGGGSDPGGPSSPRKARSIDTGRA